MASSSPSSTRGSRGPSTSATTPSSTGAPSRTSAGGSGGPTTRRRRTAGASPWPRDPTSSGRRPSPTRWRTSRTTSPPSTRSPSSSRDSRRPSPPSRRSGLGGRPRAAGPQGEVTEDAPPEVRPDGQAYAHPRSEEVPDLQGGAALPGPLEEGGLALPSHGEDDGPALPFVPLELQACALHEDRVLPPREDPHEGREEPRRGGQDDDGPARAEEAGDGPKALRGVREIVERSREDDRVERLRTEWRPDDVRPHEGSTVPGPPEHLPGDVDPDGAFEVARRVARAHADVEDPRTADGLPHLREPLGPVQERVDPIVRGREAIEEPPRARGVR